MSEVERRFERAWSERSESHYNHWTPGTPRNQIQLAFRQHWRTFEPYLRALPGLEVLEVGCGRGTISSYFADAGFRVTLADTSRRALGIAQQIYARNGHAASYVAADAFRLPFGSGLFSSSVSIGLLEHFDDVQLLMAEQLRVLRPDGVLLAYVVPERPDGVQRYFQWVNRGLGLLASAGPRNPSTAPKEPVYRNGLEAVAYERALNDLGVCDVTTHGMYPVPMISYSPEFPFSLMPAPAERGLVCMFRAALLLRRIVLRRDPWICRERVGQAFLVVARKPR